MTLFRVNIPWGVKSFTPRAVTMYGPCRIRFLLGEKFLVSQLHPQGFPLFVPQSEKGR